MIEPVQRDSMERQCRELSDLSGADSCALTCVIDRLIDAYKPQQIYLFGSKARGDSGPDSDFDVMVVVADDAPEEQRRSCLAYERLWDTGVAADVLVWTHGRFHSRTHLRASLPGTILREGKLLYAT